MIKINYNIKKGPWGGGNQFLRALKEELVQNKLYTEKIFIGQRIRDLKYHNKLNAIILSLQEKGDLQIIKAYKE